MAARDRYTTNITCPDCQQKGKLHLSEDDHPYMTNPHRTVDQIEGDFGAVVKDGIKVLLRCNKCNSSFEL
jgi:hypothetical protein